MPKPKTTRVLSERAVKGGKRSAEGRQRDPQGRLLPRQPAEPDAATVVAPETPPVILDPVSEPEAPPAPPFAQVRRRFTPLPGRRR